MAKASVIGESPDLRVGKVSMNNRPQVLNPGPASRFCRDAIFGQ